MVATPEGLQPPTSALGKPCSMQLSYGATRRRPSGLGRFGKVGAGFGWRKSRRRGPRRGGTRLWLSGVNLPDVAVNKGRMGPCQRFGPDSFRACSDRPGLAVNGLVVSLGSASGAERRPRKGRRNGVSAGAGRRRAGEIRTGSGRRRRQRWRAPLRRRRVANDRPCRPGADG